MASRGSGARFCQTCGEQLKPGAACEFCVPTGTFQVPSDVSPREPVAENTSPERKKDGPWHSLAQVSLGIALASPFCCGYSPLIAAAAVGVGAVVLRLGRPASRTARLAWAGVIIGGVVLLAESGVEGKKKFDEWRAEVAAEEARERARKEAEEAQERARKEAAEAAERARIRREEEEKRAAQEAAERLATAHREQVRYWTEALRKLAGMSGEEMVDQASAMAQLAMRGGPESAFSMAEEVKGVHLAFLAFAEVDARVGAIESELEGLSEPEKPEGPPKYEAPEKPKLPLRISGSYMGECEEGFIFTDEGIVVQQGEKLYCITGVETPRYLGQVVTLYGTPEGKTVSLVQGKASFSRLFAGKMKIREAEVLSYEDPEDVAQESKKARAEYEEAVAKAKAKFAAEQAEYKDALAKFASDKVTYKARKAELEAAAKAGAEELLTAAQPLAAKAAKGLAGFQAERP